MNFVLEMDVLVRVAGAMAVGVLLGLERELSEKPAGLRTHLLVSASACLFVLLGDMAISRFSATEGSDVIRADPIRIFEAIVVGVSFIGTGTIWHSERHHRVEGLTTAASLLFAAALGVAVALDRFLLALVLALAALAIGRTLRWIEQRFLED